MKKILIALGVFALLLIVEPVAVFGCHISLAGLLLL